MALSAQELLSGGFVRDNDYRLVVTEALGGGSDQMQFASISTAASGSTQLVAADATRKINVVAFTVVASAAVTVQFLSGASALTGAMALAANGGVSSSASGGNALFQTAVNNALNINLGGAVQVSGYLSYYLL
jgi:hypothetical protein